MSVKLVHSDPGHDIDKRLIRLQHDALVLSRLLTPAEVRAVYDKIEAVRDVLSLILDRADGKHAGTPG